MNYERFYTIDILKRSREIKKALTETYGKLSQLKESDSEYTEVASQASKLFDMLKEADKEKSELTRRLK
jgi:hypothetical protein